VLQPPQTLLLQAGRNQAHGSPLHGPVQQRDLSVLAEESECFNFPHLRRSIQQILLLRLHVSAAQSSKFRQPQTDKRLRRRDLRRSTAFIKTFLLKDIPMLLLRLLFAFQSRHSRPKGGPNGLKTARPPGITQRHASPTSLVG
jgi:hypothetical protein